MYVICRNNMYIKSFRYLYNTQQKKRILYGHPYVLYKCYIMRTRMLFHYYIGLPKEHNSVPANRQYSENPLPIYMSTQQRLIIKIRKLKFLMANLQKKLNVKIKIK